jgi:Gpi18-like mannosyltransferase
MDWPRFFFVMILMMVAVGIRAAMFNQITADYESHLRIWVETFRQSGAQGLAMEVGDYNLPYQYIILLISNLPLNALYLIKYVSILFDFALAILLMCVAERFLDKKYGLTALSAALLIPTFWFNGAFWAQCDSLYCFFVLACLYAMLADRPVLSVSMLAVAFSFKLQTIFFFPLVFLGLWEKKYKLRHLFVFPAVYMLTILPALLIGRSLASALSVYVKQASQYNDRLTYNAPNIYQFFPFGEVGLQPAFTSVLKFIPGVDAEQWNEWYTPETVRYLLAALIPYAGMLMLCLAYYLYRRRKRVGMEHVWLLALAFTLLMPLLLPKMHDRYFALAEIFAILYAFRYPGRWFVPVLVIFASFESYMPFLARERPLDMRIAAAMMIAAAGFVLRDVLYAFRTDTGNVSSLRKA